MHYKIENAFITSKTIYMRTPTSILFSFAVMLSLWSCQGDHDSKANAETLGQEENSGKLSVQAPFEHTRIAPQEFTIEDPTQPASFELPGGTTIEVPAMAFSTPDGSPVSGPVTLSYREFHEASEIIASGIPMRVKNEDGSEGWMQTAGMFEISAENKGRPVHLAEGKSVEIGFVSAVEGAYDFWSFDEEVGNWLKRGEGRVPEPLQEEVASEAERQKQLEQIRRNKPQNPEVPESEILGFTDLDVSHIPELEGSSTVMLTYAGKDPSMSPANNSWVHDAQWLRKKIEPTGQKGIYRLTLLGEKRYSIPVKAALQGDALEQAKARYAKELKQYKAQLAALKNQQAIRDQQDAFRRRVAVSSMGIHNYDILLKMEEAVPLLADFDFGEVPEAVKNNITVYLITGEGRAVVGLPYHDWNRFRFVPELDNKIIAVLPGDQVAVFSQSDFNEQEPAMLKAKGQSYNFDMSVEKRKINTLEDLQEVIQGAS